MEHRHSATDQDHPGGVNLVVFSVRALRFAVESSHVRAIVDLAPNPMWPQATEQAAPSLADLLGLAPAAAATATPQPRERLLRLKPGFESGREPGLPTNPDAGREMRIQEPVSLVRARIDALYPMPALISAVSALPCVRGIVGLCDANSDNLAILLDPRRIPPAGQDPRLGTGQEDGPKPPSATSDAFPLRAC